MFKCDSCGKCCENVGWNRLLPSTNGVCDYLKDDLCSIYETRPKFCRVDDSYEDYKDILSIEEYYSANERVCNILKGIENVNR